MQSSAASPCSLCDIQSPEHPHEAESWYVFSHARFEHLSFWWCFFIIGFENKLLFPAGFDAALHTLQCRQHGLWFPADTRPTQSDKDNWKSSSCALKLEITWSGCSLPCDGCCVVPGELGCSLGPCFALEPGEQLSFRGVRFPHQ